MRGRTLAALLLSLLLGLVLASAAGARSTKPTLITPLPFDHSTHTAALERVGLQCTDCHGFEATPSLDATARPLIEVPPPAEGSAASPPVAPSLCHGCHRSELPLRPAAPTACALCHPVRDELRPRSHDPDWTQNHGREARRPKAECSDCHDLPTCVACHETRGALARDPHPPGFRSLHGLEARLDPASCDTCHTAEACVSCHTSGAIPW